MRSVLKAVKYFLPEKFLKKIRPFWHGFFAILATLRYGRPAEKLVVIGITGTAGKSTTVQLLAHILNKSGIKAGYITTVGFFDGERELINKHGLSMPGPLLLQKDLAELVANDCKVAVLETTSEGLAQNRHLGINFDVVAITNISEAHLDAHGGFENYRKAKGRLVQALNGSPAKKRLFKEIKKALFVNIDDNSCQYFSALTAYPKYAISIFGGPEAAIKAEQCSAKKIYLAEQMELMPKTSFVVDGVNFSVAIPGRFNAYNALMAIAITNYLGVSLEEAANALAAFKGVSGRMQEVTNSRGIKIFIDYAPEPLAMLNSLETVSAMPHKKIIHVFGSTGGHRDVQKRFEFGKISSRFADEIIVTNDDVYDSDPEKIADDVVQGIHDNTEKKKDLNVARILDRETAMAKALEIAEQGDIILVTGKGSEQFLVLPGNKRIDWDEKSVLEKLLGELK